ncbi:MAG: hypothetical protein DHS20C14_21230 [Phycisphaeraceae bacterium]|nr:MAG: hypothetical protein DHS20C14_21230 [Phycisphaeraceae bacterium]
MQANTTRSGRARRAFTLVEVLVTISIISILLAILLPALGKARTASRQTLALVNARTVAMSFDEYLNDNDETYPFIPLREDPNIPGGGEAVYFQWWPENTFIGVSDAFALEWAWPAVLKSVAPWQESYPVWVSPGMSTDLPENPPDFGEDDSEPAEEFISWRLSSAFLGDPKIWDADDPGTDASLHRAVRRGEVTFASSKVLLWDTHLAYLRGAPELREGHWDAPTPMAFADGHAAVNNPLDAREGVSNALRFGDDRRLHNTADGAKGIDY